MRAAEMSEKRAELSGSGVANQLGDDLAGLLPPLRGERIEPRGIGAADSHYAGELRLRTALMRFDEARVDRSQKLVEVAGLGIGVCPGVLGHGSVPQDLTVGAADQEPSIRVARSGIANRHAGVAEQLLGFFVGDTAPSQLLGGDVGDEELVNHVHRRTLSPSSLDQTHGGRD